MVLQNKFRSVDFDNNIQTDITNEEINAVNDCFPIIVLKTKKTKCDYCKAPLECIKREKGVEKFIIYTRYGTQLGQHLEYRCTNRQNCRKGHYYGYSVTDKQTNYDRDCLQNEYLVTSRQTAFSVMYLYDITLQILFSNSSFQSLAKIYNNLHFSKPTGKYREEIFQERITDAFFLYSLLEISQRYGLPTIFNPVIEVSLTECLPILKIAHREYWTNQHKCDAPGCGTCIVLDGGMKPHRKVCAAKMSGVKIFEKAGVKTVTGCTKIPAPKSKFCHDHKDEESPCILSNKVQQTTRESLKQFRKKHSKDKSAPQDNVFSIESILNIGNKKGKRCYLVKWSEFPVSQSTWELESTIPAFIKKYYEKKENLGKKLPNPVIKRSKKVGKNTIFHFLSWEGESGGTWLDENIFIQDEINNLVNVETSACNTRKDVDKRSRRHTCGILIGAYPCGVVPLIDELFGSESTSQGKFEYIYKIFGLVFMSIFSFIIIRCKSYNDNIFVCSTNFYLKCLMFYSQCAHNKMHTKQVFS